jgi:hypothetical protein
MSLIYIHYEYLGCTGLIQMKNMSQVWVLYWIFYIIIIIIQFVCNILDFWLSFFIVVKKQIRLPLWTEMYGDS